jgi:hypothetical protein
VKALIIRALLVISQKLACPLWKLLNVFFGASKLVLTIQYTEIQVSKKETLPESCHEKESDSLLKPLSVSQSMAYGEHTPKSCATNTKYASKP